MLPNENLTAAYPTRLFIEIEEYLVIVAMLLLIKLSAILTLIDIKNVMES